MVVCATVNEVNSLPVPVIDVNRLRQIMETVRRMGETNNALPVDNIVGNGFNGTEPGTGIEQTVKGSRTEEGSDIASSRSQSPETCTHNEEKKQSSSFKSAASSPATLKPVILQPQLSNGMGIGSGCVLPRTSHNYRHLPKRFINISHFIVSPEEANRAKVLILDLLGWGVSPEYILQRGVSHEFLCYVFTDLKLRIPDSIAADFEAIKTASVRQ